jgi:heterodisulfide reductase subunit B
LKYALFLGCTIPARALDYELSARKVLKALCIETVDLDFGCCGFPIEAVDEEKGLALAASNLSLAEGSGLDVLTLCSACAEMLSKAKLALGDEKRLGGVNKVLKDKLGREYEGGVKVKHLARALYEEYGVDKIRERVSRPLKGLKIAVHYGCHYMRPSRIYGEFDDPEFPESLDRLVEATGAESIDYENKMACCGGGILNIDEAVAVEMTKTKLEALSKREVDALVLICPFCGIMYSRYQRLILKEGREIPVIYYPQLLGLALGLGPDELGFQLNMFNVKGLLEKVGV